MAEWVNVNSDDPVCKGYDVRWTVTIISSALARHNVPRLTGIIWHILDLVKGFPDFSSWVVVYTQESGYSREQ